MQASSPAIGLVFEYVNDIHYTTNVGSLNLKLGDLVIARTVRSKEIGRVIQVRPDLPHRDGDPFVRKVLRLATEKDFKREEGNRGRERKAFSIAEKKIEKLGLPMTLIRVHYLFDHSRILFYFKAAGKVDFRQLVRELASVFKARIELRQIGVRDEAKMLGGVATCGRPLCCSTWLRSFAPVTVRMAKDQHLSLNPNKISGLCGRLQCCLEYEQPFYEETLKGVPNMGSQVRTPAGDGKLIKANIFKGLASILLPDSSVALVPLDEVSRKPRSSSDRSRTHQKRKKSSSSSQSSGDRDHRSKDRDSQESTAKEDGHPKPDGPPTSAAHPKPDDAAKKTPSAEKGSSTHNASPAEHDNSSEKDGSRAAGSPTPPKEASPSTPPPRAVTSSSGNEPNSSQSKPPRKHGSSSGKEERDAPRKSGRRRRRRGRRRGGNRPEQRNEGTAPKPPRPAGDTK